MKVLIAIVMFLVGLFVGILIVPTFKEFSTPLYVEEEYSSPRIKSILSGFGVTLPLEASNLNLFLRQDGQKKQVWVKFECNEEVRDAFIEQLNSKHPGLFNREVETPKMYDGTPITWWSFSNTFRYYEFDGMCGAYDDILHNFYIYASSDSGKMELSSEKNSRSYPLGP